MSWEKTPDFLGWVRQPIAGRYLRYLKENQDAALAHLLGAASVSQDPAVRARWATWKALSDQTEMLQNSRKENADDWPAQ